MGIYSRYVFPVLMDYTMSSGTLGQLRQELLKDVSGNVLEIGFGTGLNLRHYPEHVKVLTTIDNNSGMHHLASKRIEQSGKTVKVETLDGNNIPLADYSFDCIVSTWTLCSIQEVDRALREVFRLLKPGGRFFFMEHGLSEEPSVQKWQHRLTPLQKKVGDGCHLNRDIVQIISRQFNTIDSLKRFYLEGVPKWAGYMYQGIAVKQE
ncbi:MAG: class I SAM-dependent methyltransferase [SAR324 cluster bacterium]|nr:class I SAM-dependent methyltransferase [SAR324 cluster bacterium]